MVVDSIKTAVTSDYKHKALIRGTLIAGAAAVALALSAIWLPVAVLSIYGLPVYLAGFGAITWGLLPYRQLGRQERTPDEIICTGGGKAPLLYRRRGRNQLTIPQEAIAAIAYKESRGEYGIAITFVAEPKEKIRVHSQDADIGAYRLYCRRRHGCDLFLPFFTLRAFKALERCMHDDAGGDVEEDG